MNSRLPLMPGSAGSALAVERAARQAIERTIRAGVQTYDRLRDLPGLVRMDPAACAADAGALQDLIVARLARALRAERSKARSGHWTYDLNRHIALRQAYVAEIERQESLRGGRR